MLIFLQSGELSTAKLVDREIKELYELEIIAYDSPLELRYSKFTTKVITVLSLLLQKLARFYNLRKF